MKNNQKSIISDSGTKNIIIKLQDIIEIILKHKNFTEIFKMLVFLLRKYLPQDFSIRIERGRFSLIVIIILLFYANI